MILAASVHWGGFVWWGNFTTVDLIAATTNALNGALLARRPDHYKQFTVVEEPGSSDQQTPETRPLGGTR
jgi:hypothetical protein